MAENSSPVERDTFFQTYIRQLNVINIFVYFFQYKYSMFCSQNRNRICLICPAVLILIRSQDVFSDTDSVICYEGLLQVTALLFL